MNVLINFVSLASVALNALGRFYLFLHIFYTFLNAVTEVTELKLAVVLSKSIIDNFLFIFLSLNQRMQ